MRKSDQTLSDRQVGFCVSASIARKRLQEGVLPDWFKTHYCDGEIERIIKEYGFPPSLRAELLVLPLALHLSISQPDIPQPKQIREDLTSLRTHLSKVVDLITALEKCHVQGFGPELVEETVPNHGTDAPKHRNVGAFGPKTVDKVAAPQSNSLILVEGPSETFLRDIETFQRHLTTIEEPKGRPGQKRTAVAWAQQALDSFIDKHAPKLSSTQKIDLSKALFDTVREKHGHTRRGDAELQPRVEDRVRRAAQWRKRETRSRKIGKKMD